MNGIEDSRTNLIHRTVSRRAGAILLTVALSLAVPAGTTLAEDGNNNEFASGSGKAEATNIVEEHLSFTAHTVASEGDCLAIGYLVYSRTTTSGELEIRARVERADIIPLPGIPSPTEGGMASIVGAIESSTLNGVPLNLGRYGEWVATDAGLADGTGDTIRFVGPLPTSHCAPPILGDKVVQGNVVIKVEPTILP
jgi:hypothetical protein